MRIRTIVTAALTVVLLAGCAPGSSSAPLPTPASRQTDTVEGTATFDVPRGWRAVSEGSTTILQPRVADTNQVRITVLESRKGAKGFESAARLTRADARQDDDSARFGADRTFDDRKWFTVSSTVESDDGTTERLAYGTVTGGYRLLVQLETDGVDDSTALDARETLREVMDSVRLSR